MSWKETCAMEERMRFVLACKEEFEAFSDVCRHFGISRKTGYKWRNRYTCEGVEGLIDRSRAPHECPHSISMVQSDALLALRHRHPSWGPRKIKAWLELNVPGTAWPAPSTIGLVFDRAGLTRPRKRRRRTPPFTHPFGQVVQSNDTWCADFKGWFRTQDGGRVDPLTITDAHSRYLIRCEAVERPNERHVWPVYLSAFREFGLPTRLRTDNGPPFATTAVGGLSRLAVKLIKAGITPERIEPGKPQQNGRHERMHLTLKNETAAPPAANLNAQKVRFTKFQHIFNSERPHEALGQVPPAHVYQPSRRSYAGLKSPEYQMETEIRRVRTNGEIKWKGNLIFVSEALIGEPVGLREVDNDTWLLAYGPVTLGTIKGKAGLQKVGSGGISKAKPYNGKGN
jgi:transposase InsO family protein